MADRPPPRPPDKVTQTNIGEGLPKQAPKHPVVTPPKPKPQK
jgi:hypothetical protein